MSQSQITQDLQRVFQEGLSLDAWTYLFILLCAAIGSFLGAYLKRRGENLATKQDVAEITRITEEIRTRIENDVWQSQRFWDEKKALYVDLIQRLNRIADGLWTILENGFDRETQAKRPEGVTPDQVGKLIDSIDDYLQHTGIAFVFLSTEACLALQDFSRTSKELFETAYSNGKEYEYFRGLKRVVDGTYDRMIAAAKADLRGDGK